MLIVINMIFFLKNIITNYYFIIIISTLNCNMQIVV